MTDSGMVQAGRRLAQNTTAMRLSVIVITRNEERAIARCLESVRFADELIVLDSGSTDRTVEICESLGARVVRTPDWPGFGPQKNRAAALATGDWLLSIDADEWVSHELAAEIRAVVAEASDVQAFEIARRSSFCGRFMRHSGWSPDLLVRLFRRGAARFSDDTVHERLIVQGRRGRLSGLLYHETFRDLEHMLTKLNSYTSASAQMMLARGRRGSVWGALLHGMWAFIRTYLLRAGFLDGHEGFILAVATAENAFYRYLKLLYLQRNAPDRRDAA